jgi:RNA polymerase sigma-70 factor (ECF subfamily)
MEQLERYRAELTGHCYRMLGSIACAEDAVQEAMVRAWRGWDRFEGRAKPRTWLYRIATNVCIDALADRARRTRPIDDRPPGTPRDTLSQRPHDHWLQPAPDHRVIPEHTDPEQRVILHQSIRLAFVAALQYLPPRQRAVLLLRQVLGWSAAEVADTLETSVASVNSALQRARARLDERAPAALEPSPAPDATLSEHQAQLLQRYVDAFESYDVEALTALLCQDAIMSMPPYELWLQGRAAIHEWLLGVGKGCRGSRFVHTRACGQPALAQYRQGGRVPWALNVLDIRDDGIAGWTAFLDVEALFPAFGMPPCLVDG